MEEATALARMTQLPEVRHPRAHLQRVEALKGTEVPNELQQLLKCQHQLLLMVQGHPPTDGPTFVREAMAMCQSTEGFIDAEHKRSFCIIVCEAIRDALTTYDRHNVLDANMQQIFLDWLGQDEDAELAMQAAEVWCAYVEQRITYCLSCENHIGLEKLIPVLVRRMRLSEAEIEIFDRANRLAEEKAARLAAGAPTGEPAPDGAADDEDEPDDSPWTIRKCCASLLDQLFQSNHQIHAHISVLVPMLEEVVQHYVDGDDDNMIEAAILALGAAAEGMIPGYSNVLATKWLPVVVRFLDHPNPRVRTISCWTCGRYNDQVFHPDSPTPEILAKLLTVAEHGPSAVTQAAMTAASVCLEADDRDRVKVHIDVILPPAMRLLGIATGKAQMVAADTIGTMFDNFGPDLASRVDMVVPQLLDLYERSSEQNIVLSEVLASVLSGLGVKAAAYAPRAMETALARLERGLATGQNDLVVATFDLISAVLCSWEKGAPLESVLDGTLSKFVAQALRADVIPDDVAQSVCGVVGDLSLHGYAMTKPNFSQWKDILDAHLAEGMALPVMNNATWAAGLLLCKQAAEERPEELSKFVASKLPLLLDTLRMPSNRIADNAAITLAKWSEAMPDSIKPCLSLEVFANWCKSAMRFVEKDKDEFVGPAKAFLSMVAAENPFTSAVTHPFAGVSVGCVITAFLALANRFPELQPHLCEVMDTMKMTFNEDVFAMATAYNRDEFEAMFGSAVAFPPK